MICLALPCKNILNRRFNVKDKYLNIFLLWLYYGHTFRSPTSFIFIRKITATFFPRDIVRIKSRDPSA